MIKFKNRLNGFIVDMETYDKMSIDEQWDYDMINEDVWAESPKKISVSWQPALEQDIDAIINPNSPFYNAEILSQILEQYGSVDEFKKHVQNNNI